MKEKKVQASYEEATIRNLNFLQAVFLVIIGALLVFTVYFICMYSDTCSKRFADTSLANARDCALSGFVFSILYLLVPSVKIVVKAAHLYVKQHEEK